MCNKTALEIVREAKGTSEVETSGSSDNLHELTCRRFVFTWIEEVLRELGIPILKVVPVKYGFIHSVNDLTLKGWAQAGVGYTAIYFDDSRFIPMSFCCAVEAANKGDLKLAEKLLVEDLVESISGLIAHHPTYKKPVDKLPKNSTNPRVTAFLDGLKAIEEREATEKALFEKRVAKFRETFSVLETLMKDINPDIELRIDAIKNDNALSIGDDFDIDESFDVDVFYTLDGSRIHSFVDADEIDYDLPVEECVAAILDEYKCLVENLLTGAAKYQQAKADQQCHLQKCIEGGLVRKRGE